MNFTIRRAALGAALALTIGATGVASAQPTILNVAGTIAHDQVITISGSGFGAKAPAPPLLYDTVDNRPEYAGLADGDPIPNSGAGGVWDGVSDDLFAGPGKGLRFSTSRAQRHPFVTAHYHGVGGKAFVGALASLRAADPAQVYISWYTKYEDDPDDAPEPTGVGGECGPGTAPGVGSGSNKILRIVDDTVNFASGNVIGPTQFNVEFFTTGGSQQSQFSATRNFGADPAAINVFNRFEIFFDAGANVLRFSANNAPVYNASNFAKSPIAPGPFDIGLIGGFDHSLNCYQTTNHDFGEIYLDITQARVEVGNASTLAASTVRELQPPLTWSGNTVTATLNQGALPNLTGAFLYVIDSNGVANTNGFPLCPSCPASPGGLTGN